MDTRLGDFVEVHGGMYDGIRGQVVLISNRVGNITIFNRDTGYIQVTRWRII